METNTEPGTYGIHYLILHRICWCNNSDILFQLLSMTEVQPLSVKVCYRTSCCNQNSFSCSMVPYIFLDITSARRCNSIRRVCILTEIKGSNTNCDGYVFAHAVNLEHLFWKSDRLNYAMKSRRMVYWLARRYCSEQWLDRCAFNLPRAVRIQIVHGTARCFCDHSNNHASHPIMITIPFFLRCIEFGVRKIGCTNNAENRLPTMYEGQSDRKLPLWYESLCSINRI